jgi:hypothetical protein
MVMLLLLVVSIVSLLRTSCHCTIKSLTCFSEAWT